MYDTKTSGVRIHDTLCVVRLVGVLVGNICERWKRERRLGRIQSFNHDVGLTRNDDERKKDNGWTDSYSLQWVAGITWDQRSDGIHTVQMATTCASKKNVIATSIAHTSDVAKIKKSCANDYSLSRAQLWHRDISTGRVKTR